MHPHTDTKASFSQKGGQSGGECWTLVLDSGPACVTCGTMWPPALILCCLLCKQASGSEALLVLSGVEPRHFTIISLSGELLIAPAVATGVQVCV